MPALETLMEQVYASSAQSFQANQSRHLESAQRAHDAGWQHQLALQRMTDYRSLQLGFDATEVAQAYRGNALKSATEADAAQSTAEGQIYKDASQASLPITQAQHSANYNDQALKSVVDAVLAQVLTKLAQSTPPQSGGHSAESPSDRKAA
jgi:hypothetical protein